MKISEKIYGRVEKAVNIMREPVRETVNEHANADVHDIIYIDIWNIVQRKSTREVGNAIMSSVMI